jgi:hypothetical protein
MIRNIKLLALTALAALAVTAVAASAAHAENTKFTAGSTSGKVTATQTTKQVFTTNAGKVECTTAHQEGVFTAATFSSLTVTPTYSGCTAFGFIGATVTTNGCTYTYTGKPQAAGEETLATVTVNCTGANTIVVSGGGCTTTVPAQGPLNHIKFTNNTTKSPDDVDATATVSGIKYTSSGCFSGNGTFTNGTISGGSTVIARDTTGTQVNLTVDP